MFQALIPALMAVLGKVGTAASAGATMLGKGAMTGANIVAPFLKNAMGIEGATAGTGMDIAGPSGGGLKTLGLINTIKKIMAAGGGSAEGGEEAEKEEGTKKATPASPFAQYGNKQYVPFQTQTRGGGMGERIAQMLQRGGR